MLSLCQGASKKIETGEKMDIRCCIVSDDEGFIMAAVQTPPHNLILSKSAHANIDQLAETLAANKCTFSGIVGPSDVVSLFSGKWEALVGQEYIEFMDQVIYALKDVVLPSSVKGRLHFAKKGEEAQAAVWLQEFAASALPRAEQLTPEQALAKAKSLIKEKRLAVWVVDGKPVAQATCSGTDDIERIGSVYTPEENRCKGYATALVAHLSKFKLDEEGKRLCCLYTDARNTKSNSIYRKVGYEFVGRSSLYTMRQG
jgi:predicted GNAT family acetyltransferase